MLIFIVCEILVSVFSVINLVWNLNLNTLAFELVREVYLAFGLLIKFICSLHA